MALQASPERPGRVPDAPVVVAHVYHRVKLCVKITGIGQDVRLIGAGSAADGRRRGWLFWLFHERVGVSVRFAGEADDSAVVDDAVD